VLSFHRGKSALPKGKFYYVIIKDYKEIQHVILEMAEEVARRARRAKKAGRTISLGIGYSTEELGGGFYRSKTIDAPTNITMDIYTVFIEFFHSSYEGKTVRKISIGLSNTCDDSEIQLNLFRPNQEKQRELGHGMDQIRAKLGSDAL
jgi:DNA polymerase V